MIKLKIPRPRLVTIVEIVRDYLNDIVSNVEDLQANNITQYDAMLLKISILEELYSYINRKEITTTNNSVTLKLSYHFGRLFLESLKHNLTSSFDDDYKTSIAWLTYEELERSLPNNTQSIIKKH